MFPWDISHLMERLIKGNEDIFFEFKDEMERYKK
jgi:hypothetical protein